jgi:hypothetical protein
MLKYDSNTSSNWAVLVKALSIVAGIQFGNLFNYVQEGSYPVLEVPILKSCARERQLDLKRIEREFPDPNSIEHGEALVVHVAEFNLTQVEIDIRDIMYLLAG